MIRNITFDHQGSAGVPPASSSTPSSTDPVETILRTRAVTVSPAEEYQLRPGEVRPISDELAAAILSFKGRAKVGNKGVVVDRVDIGGRYVYFHEDSIAINDFSAREKKLYYVINRLVPEVLHLLDETGAYIESLPLRERPAVLDTEAQAGQLRQNKTIANRAAKRLQKLQAPVTREALEDLAANSREMRRVVQTLPAPCSDPATRMPPHRSTHGEAAAAGARRINDMRANKASAVALGRAVAANRRESPEPSGPPAEDWSSLPARNPSTLTEIESW